MSLKDEIRKLIDSELTSLRNEQLRTTNLSKKSFKMVLQLQPLLNEIASSVDNELIKIDINNNWQGDSAAVFIRIGDLTFYGDCTYAENLLPVGNGSYWYFFPCYSEDGKESWSFNDQRRGHQWFDSSESLFSHLIPLLAKEIAKHEHENT